MAEAQAPESTFKSLEGAVHWKLQNDRGSPLWVFGYPDLVALFELKSDDYSDLKDRVRFSLMNLDLQIKKSSLIQFWLARPVGNHIILSASNVPFALSQPASFEVCMFRRLSQEDVILVDTSDESRDVTPVSRVYRRKQVEWSPDVSEYDVKEFPKQGLALRCKLNGYLALPIWDQEKNASVGVIELLAPSDSLNFPDVIKGFNTALQEQNLFTAQAFQHFHIDNDREKISTEIRDMLERICNKYALPLAQTWSYSQLSVRTASRKKVIDSCCSFHPGCIQKVCMSTDGLPSVLRDVNMRHFQVACAKTQLVNEQASVFQAIQNKETKWAVISEQSIKTFPFLADAESAGLYGYVVAYMKRLDPYVLELYYQSDVDPLEVCQELEGEILAYSLLKDPEASTSQND